jgi:hypothetical protein
MEAISSTHPKIPVLTEQSTQYNSEMALHPRRTEPSISYGHLVNNIL